MKDVRPFTADSNKLAYAQAFSRVSARRLDAPVRSGRRHSLALRRTRKPSV